MCGIIGVFNHHLALEQVQQALVLLKNRGRDGSACLKLNSTAVMGHTLHAVVNKVPQPLQEGGAITTNCEIYNWQELDKKYSFNARNDAELLLRFLDRFGLQKIGELEGVFALAYYQNQRLILVRDILGEKPLWYSHNQGNFAFASEAKVLQQLGYTDIIELNPRQIATYIPPTNTLLFQYREFFSYLPEHKETYLQIKQHTSLLLDKAIQKRVPAHKFGLLFSGGVDSTYLAKYFKDHNYDFTCYTAILEDGNSQAPDLIAAKLAAEKLGLNLVIVAIKLKEIPFYLQQIVPLIEDSNVVKVGVALPFFIACQAAGNAGCKVIFSGLGSEEIFAGYDRHKSSSNINQECLSGLLKLYERDLYRDDVITMENGLELRLPYLDQELVSYVLKIPGRYKIKEPVTKLILRHLALEKGLPEQVAFRKKTAAQYGSRFDWALGKLAKQHKISSKSQYLKTFYSKPNQKLGVLFSSGKDSTSAAYIMKKQNYDIACLITLKPKNQHSYMFQKAGTELVQLQSEAMGIPLLVQETNGEKEEELIDLEIALKRAKGQYALTGIVSGALFSTYQRDRIEKICDKLGLKIFAPLWHKQQETHLQEVIKAGFVVIITAIAADGMDETWLGREINSESLIKLKSLIHSNMAGEGGEYESLVLDGPLFNRRIEITASDKMMDSRNSGRLIIKQARLVEKKG